MCGRYEIHTPIATIAQTFQAALTSESKELLVGFNIAPSSLVPIIRQREHKREVAVMSWGLVPPWSGPAHAKPINARVETLFEKSMFREAIARRRCLIPADGFYEWEPRPGRKQPWHIGMKDGAMFAFAGIWEMRNDKDGQPLVSCAVIVTEANDLVRPIHDRMPVIIAPEDYDRWLDPDITTRLEIEPMLAPYPAQKMRAYPVSPRVNSVKNDGPDLIEPLTDLFPHPS